MNLEGFLLYSLILLKYDFQLFSKTFKHCINNDIFEKLKNIAERLFKEKNCEIIEINGEKDHVHILFEAPPQVQPSKLVNNFKTVTSRLIRKEFDEYLKQFYWKPVFWSNSYCIVSTGGATTEIIKEYIENQAS